MSRRYSAAIVISKAASTRWSARIISPRRRWWLLIAMAGRIDIDLIEEPLGIGKDGKTVFCEISGPPPRR